MERLQQIEAIFQEALRHEPAERDAYVLEVCRGDSELQREVASLLANHGKATDFEPWAATAAAHLIDRRLSLEVGRRLGPYQILAPIGAGGMGEVYRAHDTKLKRDVALKVLPEAFARDPGRMARFEREAEVLASLNHTNIAQIYGVEERALVMELVEGESPKGPLPFEDAWKIASQIADALEYAHERGVIHRDLKPANVKITPDGVVKLLDFGLAKAFSDQADGASSDPSNSPTVTLGATVAGVILGTAAYMAPEQAKGRRVDKRADIWSWGVVLYELLTGEQVFKGEDTADTLAQVLAKEPDLERVPGKVRRLLGECLQKQPKLRLRDIGDAKRLLEEEAAPTAPAHFRLEWIVAAVALLVFVGLGWVAWKHFREEPPRVMQLFFPPPENGAFNSVVGPSMAVSPDGRRVAFEAVADGKAALWIRDLDAPSARRLVDVEAPGTAPFWAPDSRWLGYYDGSKLKRIDVTGGPAVTILDPGFPKGGASWNRDDVILFSALQTGAGLASSTPPMPLFRVADGGGSRAPVTELDQASKEVQHLQPWFLPDGRHFLYVAYVTDREKNDVWVGDLASKTRRALHIGGSRAIYVNPGYLLFVRRGTLMAQPFDTGKLETTGDAAPLAEQVSYLDVNGTAWGWFLASQNGVLAYMGGTVGNVQLTWFDRTGKKLDTAGAPGKLEWFSLSPDGERIALTRVDVEGQGSDIWTRDLAHGSDSRLTSIGRNRYPVWSADGTHIFFVSNRDGSDKLYWKAANGAGPEESLEAAVRFPMDASRDGRYLFTMIGGGHTWVLPLFGDRKPFPYPQTEFREMHPRLSPDGQWLAYYSNGSKRNEIYVTSFPQPGGRWQISNNGGRDPVWSHDGRELYYYSEDEKIMAVEIKPGASFQFGVPKALFPVRIAFYNTTFDVSKDGRFLLPVLVEQQGPRLVTVVLNWPELLRKR